MADLILGVDAGQRHTGLALVEPVTGKLPRIVRAIVVERHDEHDALGWCRWVTDHMALFCHDPTGRDHVIKAGVEAYHWLGPRSANKQSFEMAGLVRWVEHALHMWGIPFVEVRKLDANAALGLKGKCSDARIKRALRAMFGDELDSPHKRDAVLVAVAGGRR